MINFKIYSMSHKYQGLGIGRGQVKGPVHILDGVDDHPEVGKILILDYPSVAYAKAIRESLGFIAEQGGLGSHGCTLALELGLPAIVGVHQVKKLFQEGELVEIDASAGTVKKL